MPGGMFFSGRQLPTFGGASAPLSTSAPASRPVGAEDVALLAVDIVQQGDAGAAVRIVLDRIDLGRHAILVAAEIDQAIHPLVTAAAMPGRDPPLVVAAARLALGHASGSFPGLAPRVRSAKSLTVAPRRPGVTGL